MTPSQELIQSFPSSVFWDTVSSELDLRDHKSYIISKVFIYTNEKIFIQNIEILERFYKKEEIFYCVKNSNEFLKLNMKACNLLSKRYGKPLLYTQEGLKDLRNGAKRSRTINLLSDIHLEFPENMKWAKENLPKLNGDILIIAGDFGKLDQYKTYPYQEIFDILEENFNEIYIIPGNHEYYGGYDISKVKDGVPIIFGTKIKLVNNYSITIDGYRLIFSTMWTHIKPESFEASKRGLNDFNNNHLNGLLIEPADINMLHKKSVDFITAELEKDDGHRNIIITHHCPTFATYNKEHRPRMHKIRECWYVDMEYLISKYEIDYWLFGHTHECNRIEFIYTSVISNALGYTFRGIHEHFELDYKINLGW